jgi:CubicO group peptidase (beta-lactamase class C family)
MRRVLLAVALTFLALAATAADNLQRDVDRLAAETMRTWQLPGLAVAIVQNDRVVLAKGYGVKELGKPDRVTADTIFQIGSTTKAFTTTAMAMLVDEKKLDWDDPVRRHLPYFHLNDACADSLVTLRDLVSHRSGAARHDELWDNTPFTREEVIRREGEMKLAHPIRTAYLYNNIMFIAAGEAVAAAAKTPWDDFVRTRIFEPLGMTHTTTRFADWAATDHASGYAWSHGAPKPQPFLDYDNLAPAGTVASSARDMAQWLRFQLASGTVDGKRLVSADALNATKTPQFVLSVDKELNPFTNVESYAMGWNVLDYRGELVDAHAGALNGFRSQVALLPNRNAGVFVVTNVGRGYALAALRNAILDELLNANPPYDWNAAYAAADAKNRVRDADRKKEHEAKRHDENRPTHDLAAYAGTYSHRGFGDATVAIENGAFVFHWSRLAVPLTHFNYDTFDAVSEADDVDEQVQFLLSPDGAVRGMTIFGEELTKR